MLQPEDLILEKDVAMKHVGLNVASDSFMTLAYTDVNRGLVIVSADDPGMHSSQNEQDNRYHAKMAKVPLLGFLSDFLPISMNSWEMQVKDIAPSKVLEINMNAFMAGRGLINNF